MSSTSVYLKLSKKILAPRCYPEVIRTCRCFTTMQDFRCHVALGSHHGMNLWQWSGDRFGPQEGTMNWIGFRWGTGILTFGKWIRLVDVNGMVMLIIVCNMHTMYILFVWVLPKHWKASGFHKGYCNRIGFNRNVLHKHEESNYPLLQPLGMPQCTYIYLHLVDFYGKWMATCR